MILWTLKQFIVVLSRFEKNMPSSFQLGFCFY